MNWKKVKRSWKTSGNALRSVKTTNETELKQLKKKAEILVGFYEQREVVTKEKLEMTHYQLVAEKNKW